MSNFGFWSEELKYALENNVKSLDDRLLLAKLIWDFEKENQRYTESVNLIKDHFSIDLEWLKDQITRIDDFSRLDYINNLHNSFSENLSTLINDFWETWIKLPDWVKVEDIISNFDNLIYSLENNTDKVLILEEILWLIDYINNKDSISQEDLEDKLILIEEKIKNEAVAGKAWLAKLWITSFVVWLWSLLFLMAWKVTVPVTVALWASWLTLYSANELKNMPSHYNKNRLYSILSDYVENLDRDSFDKLYAEISESENLWLWFFDLLIDKIESSDINNMTIEDIEKIKNIINLSLFKYNKNN